VIPLRRAPASHARDGSPLAGVAPFDGFPPRRLRGLAAHADRVRVPEGTVLAREGGLVHELLVVLRGEVVATRTGTGTGAGAGRQGSGDRLGPGARFGALELVTGAPHPATLVAGPGLEVLVVNGPAYRGAAQVLPGLAVA
jgi:CRP-like cAMP-binding protein